MTQTFRSACLQLNSGSDLAANLATVKSMVAEAAGQGAQLVLTPEYSLMMDGSGRVMREARWIRMVARRWWNCRTWRAATRSGCWSVR